MEVQAELDNIVVQYETMIESARNEMSSMVHIYNALTISRLGFVAQEMKEIENEILMDIENRGLQINSTTAACLIDANRSLGYAANYAGLVIVEISRELIGNLNVLADDTVYPLLDMLNEIVSFYQVDLLTIHAFFNVVTDFNDAYYTFLFDIFFYELMFDYYVEFVYREMVLWNKLTNEFNGDMYQILNSGTDYFRFLGNLIKNSLIDCNP